MSRLGYLFILWIVCGSAFSSNEEQDEYIKSLGYESFMNFNDQNSGIASLASSPMAAAVLKVDKSLYPKLFDTVVSSSVDSLQSQLAPRHYNLEASTFGFNPLASQSFHHHDKSAKLVSHQAQQQIQQNNIAPNAQQVTPLRYDIRTIHDPNYKVYKPEVNDEEKDNLPLKKNPPVAAYFQPNINIEINHPLEYRKQDSTENLESKQNYKQNPYLAGSARARRYTGGRSRENLKKAETAEEEDDPYNYKAEYISKPKAFDESPYSSPYKKKKGAKDEYEYPYSYDAGYDHKEYERIKELSEKQAAEIKQNPGNCVEVKKDGMSCQTCKDPKTGGNYESCSYVAEPKNNKYAYSKERKYDSNDDPEEPEQKSDSPKKSEKLIQQDSAPQQYSKSENDKPYSSYKQADDSNDASDKYKAYYIHSSKPSPSEALRAASNEDNSEEAKAKPYNYKKALPGFYTDNDQKKDVEHVLAEFKKKDRSACKKVRKNAMTCFQCLDKTGQKHEECMFVSESAPKQSHLAYQELKEFTSKPATLDGGNEEAESQTVTTSSPPAQKSAAYVAAANYNNKSKRKKASQGSLTADASSPAVKVTHKVKRSEGSEIEYDEKSDDISNIAPPEEFAGADSKGAFWAETQPRYSRTLGVSLPEYMLARSELEDSFDEVVAGA